MITILTTILFILKFLFYITFIFLFNNSILKVILLIINIYIIYYIYTSHIRRRKTLSKLRAWKYRLFNDYSLKSTSDKIYNLAVLFIYCLIFIFGILWLRFNNTTKSINLVYYYNFFNNIIKDMSYMDLVLSLLLLISIFIIYINMLKYLKNYFKFQFVRRHIYESDSYHYYFMDLNNSLHRFMNPLNLRRYSYYGVCLWLTERFSLYDLYSSLINKIFWFLVYDDLWFLNHYKYRFLKYYGDIAHYIFAAFLLVYDIIFNHFIIEKIFIFLPFIFIHELSVQFTRFINRSSPIEDGLLYSLLYEPVRQEIGFYVLGRSSVLTAEEIKETIEYGQSDLVTQESIEKDRSLKKVRNRKIKALIKWSWKKLKNTFKLIFVKIKKISKV